MKLERFLIAVSVALILMTATPIMAKDNWIQVRSKNFFLIGNASERDVKRVATRLEQFREAFRNLFSGSDLSGSVPTNVVVFKSAGSYKPFLPRRSDGKADTGIAGYFQPGEDVNYITLTTEGPDDETFGTIFHEYVHAILEINFGKSEVPTWFNEGLAEYYQTFQIEDDIKVKLGLPQANHLALLQQSKLMPLDMLFNATGQQVHATGGHSRSIFYSQSWALVHYLLQTGKGERLERFLGSMAKGTAAEAAFKDAFQIDYATMEKELRKYVGQGSYKYSIVTFKNKLTFESDMQIAALDEATSNAYLGDLLYHTHRFDDAEPYLSAALKLDPNSSMANTAMGMVKIRQRKWDDAGAFLSKALTADARNHIAHYRYAELLSREGRDEFGMSKPIPAETAVKMREALRKAIEIDPSYTESYEMFAYLALSTGQELDTAETYLRSALKYQPGNQRYALRIAEIYLRQNKLREAEYLAEKIARTTDDNGVRARAESVVSMLRERQRFEDQVADARKQYEAAAAQRATTSGPPRLTRRVSDPLEEGIRSINGILRTLAAGEERDLGQIQAIDCKVRPIAYTVAGSDKQTFKLTSKDFQELEINVYDPALGDLSFGCDAKIASVNAVITWRPSSLVKGARGQLVAIEFVPAGFRIMTPAELAAPANAGSVVVEETVESANPPPPPSVSIPSPAQRPDPPDMRDVVVSAMRDALRKPGSGEKREMGFLEKIECKGKDMQMHFKTSAGIIKLLVGKPPTINLFTPDLAGVQFGCNIKPIEYPVVFIYVDKPKSKTLGEIVSLEFVPRSFVL